MLPLLLLIFLAIADFARLYTTMMTVESAAREAADYGAFDSQYWTDEPSVRQNMIHRACTAASNLPDYQGTTDPVAATCTNPVVEISLVPQAGSEPCTDAMRPFPCWVRATLAYDFKLIMPLRLEIGPVRFGFPATITFQRTSTFAITDLQLAPGP